MEEDLILSRILLRVRPILAALTDEEKIQIIGGETEIYKVLIRPVASTATPKGAPVPAVIPKPTVEVAPVAPVPQVAKPSLVTTDCEGEGDGGDLVESAPLYESAPFVKMNLDAPWAQTFREDCIHYPPGSRIYGMRHMKRYKHDRVEDFVGRFPEMYRKLKDPALQRNYGVAIRLRNLRLLWASMDRTARTVALARAEAQGSIQGLIALVTAKGVKLEFSLDAPYRPLEDNGLLITGPKSSPQDL